MLKMRIGKIFFQIFVAGMVRMLGKRESALAELHVTTEQVQAYLAAREAEGLSPNTLATYRAKLTQLYELLPEDKNIGSGTVRALAGQMQREGYSIPAINLLLSVADGFLLWCGRRDLQAVERLGVEESVQPEITRTEYQRLLSAAKRLGREREYLMIKTIVLTGVNLQELIALTTEDVARGWLFVNKNEMRRIPASLQAELKAFARRSGVVSGVVFRTRTNTAVSRVCVTNTIKGLAKSARVDEEKCNPRCLRKLYFDTQAHFDEMLRTLVDQAQERLLETEQRVTGWDEALAAGSVRPLGFADRQVMKD